MALQVWLPLTKDLRNQGINNVNFTNNGATYSSTGGKLGGTYSFNGSSRLEATLPTSISSSVGSLACWVKFDSLPASTAWYNLIQLGAAGGFAASRLSLYYEYGTGINISIDGSSTGQNYIAYTFSTNTWYHIACTNDGTTVKVYINGSQVLSKTATKGSYTTAATKIYCGGPTNYYLKGSMNDIRYYDHALSSMEVKHIAQGLILHYPLNRNGWGQENLLANTNTGVSYWNWTMQVGDYTRTEETTLSGVRGCKLTRGDTAQSGWSVIYWSLIDESILMTSTQYTLSLDIYPSVNTSFNVCILEANGTNQFAPYAGAQTVIANKWNHLVFSLTTVATFPSSTNETLYFTGMNNGTGISYIFRNLKLEKGSVATPWCPNSSDASATTMGLNGTTEYDCSGFCNNGTRTGTFTWTSDTPKYAVSTNATGGASTYLVGPVLPVEAKTVALWIKCSSKANNGAIFNDKTSGLQIGLLNSLLYMNSTASTAGFTTTHWVNGEWNHVVAVNNNGTRSLYVNGQAETQSGAANYYIHNADNCWLWNRSYNNNYPFTGSLSDLRVYVTALSADDVKSLYQNCATIDPDGTIRGQIRS